MKLQSKFVATAGLVLLCGSLLRVLTPVAVIANNQAVVNQMNDTNASSLRVELTGAGDVYPKVGVGALFLAGLFFVWTSKSGKNKE